MAAITQGVTQANAAAYGAESTAGTSSGNGSEVSKEMFLQLLIAQIQNQNPLDPMDGAEYLGQLAEFTNLEQMMAIRAELETISDTVSSFQAVSGAVTDSK